MAQLLALVSLLKQLSSRELSSFSSVGLNNFLFCILFLMSGSAESGRLKDAFWSTVFFQLVLLVPLMVTFSVDTLHRLPIQRAASWPLTDVQRVVLSSISFVLNPLFIVLFVGLSLWMGLAIGFFFVLLALSVHLTVFAINRLSFASRMPATLGFPGGSFKVGGIAQQMWRDLTGTLDFWAALLVALSGTLYRLFGRATEPEAFPILALFVGVAISTVGQRMFCLDEGRSQLRYRLLPIPGWRLIILQDAIFLAPLLIMVVFLSLRTGLAFGLIALTVGRYPSLRQRVNQRRWRFVGGDPRFGVAQVLLGGFAGIAAARIGLRVVAIAFLCYLGSLFWGNILWKRPLNP